MDLQNVCLRYMHKIVNKDNVNDYNPSEIGHIIDNTGKYSINDDILTIK